MKKIVSITLILVMSAVLLTGCGSKKSSNSSGNVKIYLSYTADDFRQAFADAAIEEAEGSGITIDANAEDDTVEKQVESIKKAVSEGCTAILCIPVDPATAQQLEVAANGVPIIFCNSKPDSDYLKSNEYIYVGSSEEQAGQFQAEKLMALYPSKKEFNIVMFKGVKDHSGTVGRQNGFKYTMKENNIKINYVFEDFADWSGETAVAKFEQFLKTGQPYDAVVCHNDTMAVAVADYMMQNGISTSDIPVFGVDATADGLASIKNGGLTFTVYQSANGQGVAAVQAAALLSKGQSIETIEGVDTTNTYVYVPFEAVDKSNASKY